MFAAPRPGRRGAGGGGLALAWLLPGIFALPLWRGGAGGAGRVQQDRGLCLGASVDLLAVFALIVLRDARRVLPGWSGWSGWSWSRTWPAISPGAAGRAEILAARQPQEDLERHACRLGGAALVGAALPPSGRGRVAGAALGAGGIGRADGRYRRKRGQAPRGVKDSSVSSPAMAAFSTGSTRCWGRRRWRLSSGHSAWGLGRMKRISILGATGSIGQSTIDLMRRDRRRGAGRGADRRAQYRAAGGGCPRAGGRAGGDGP